MSGKYRLLTRLDFDGLVCAALLRRADMIDEIIFVHPKDMQDRKVAVTDRDISTNLPYVPGVHQAFDHHLSETIRLQDKPDNLVIDPNAPSAARVVYNHLGGKERFPDFPQDMLAAVDEADAAQFTEFEQIFEPTGWVLLNHLIDPLTGLGRYDDRFRVPQPRLVLDLVDASLKHGVDEILELPDVKERVDFYFEAEAKAKEQITRCATVHQNLVVIDLRNETTIHPVNRFVVYAMYPKCNISMHTTWSPDKQRTVFAVGKSIVNPTSNTNVGELMLQYGGGGHVGAGTCQVDNDKAEQVRAELIKRIAAEG